MVEQDLAFSDYTPAGGCAPSVGEILRSGREARGLTIEQVAEVITVPQHYLSAIEENRFKDLPGQTYAYGFVRNYGRFLDVEPDALVEQLKLQVEFPAAINTANLADGFVDPPRQTLLPGATSIVAGLVVAIGVYGIWFAASQKSDPVLVAPAQMTAGLPSLDRQTSKPLRELPASLASAPKPTLPRNIEVQDVVPAGAFAPNAPAVERRVLAAAVSAPAPVADPLSDQLAASSVGDVEILVDAESWIEVRARGRIVYSGVKQAGETLRISSEIAQQARMVTGNAGGIRLALDDWKSAPLGGVGDVRRGISLSPQGLRDSFAPAKTS